MQDFFVSTVGTGQHLYAEAEAGQNPNRAGGANDNPIRKTLGTDGAHRV